MKTSCIRIPTPDDPVQIVILRSGFDGDYIVLTERGDITRLDVKYYKAEDLLIEFFDYADEIKRFINETDSID